jgi:signal peptidase II
MPSVPKVARWFGLAGLVMVLDYLTKIAVLASFAPGESRVVAPFFNLVLVFNKGAAFSFLASAQGWQTLAFAAIAVVASIVISVLILKNKNKKLFCSALAFILGGALGNLVDRIAYGHVVDFLDFHAMGWHWPAFNAADSAITLGAAILIVESFLHREPESGEKGA